MLAVVLLFLLGLTWWRSGRIAQKTISPLVMGTTSRLIAVGKPHRIDAALAAARRELDAVNSRMSTYDAQSELSRFNRAEAGVEVPLSDETLEVLRRAQQLSQQTRGAFDVTVRPLSRLWQQAEEAGQLPTADRVAGVLTCVGSDRLQIRTGSACKKTPGVEVTLDAIAKGHAIHRAVQALRRFDLVGGLVDVGGDIECFGRPLRAKAWRIAVQRPAADARLLVLECLPRDGTLAVCTSGDYRRFVVIEAQRYSHIIDPRSGQPAHSASSVTVVGPDAVLADGWATALSVMGPQEGLRRLPTQLGLEALLVSGPADAPKLHQTHGFRRYVASARP